MKVFVSWSGDQSQKVGEALYNWLPKVLQAAQPWFSPEDLGKGLPWAEVLFRELQQVKIGVFCLTPGNLAAPWIAFEAAACMAKAEGRVFTYLHGVKYSDVTGPLSIFNHSLAEREGTFRLVSNMNALLPVPLSKEALHDTFEVWWPKLEKALKEIPPVAPDTPKPTARSDSEILKETLEVVRSLQAQIADWAVRPRSQPDLEAMDARWKRVDTDVRRALMTRNGASEMEAWVAGAVALGIPTAVIADDLAIAEGDALKLLHSVYEKIGVKSAAEFARWTRVAAGRSLFVHSES